MKCKKGYEIGTHRSAVGYYLGTVDEEGCPNCRITGYANTAEKAKSLPFTRMNCIENAYCNGCGDCFVNK